MSNTIMTMRLAITTIMAINTIFQAALSWPVYSMRYHHDAYHHPYRYPHHCPEHSIHHSVLSSPTSMMFEHRQWHNRLHCVQNDIISVLIIVIEINLTHHHEHIGMLINVIAISTNIFSTNDTVTSIRLKSCRSSYQRHHHRHYDHDCQNCPHRDHD